MSFETPERFPCGEFKPGFEPRPGTGINNSNPPNYVPSQLNNENSFIVGGGTPPTNGPDNPIPGGGPPGSQTPTGPSTGGPAISSPTTTPTTTSTGTGAPTGGAPSPTGPSTGGGTTPTPYRPGDVTGPRPRGAVTPRGSITDVRWKCAERKQFCPPPSNESQALIVSATYRQCVQCATPVASSRGELAQWAEGCNYLRQSDCVSYCRSTTVSPNPCVTYGPSTQTSQPPQTGSSPSQEVLRNSITSNNVITNSTIDSSLIKQSISRKTASTIVINNKAFRKYATASGSLEENISLYDPTYNFFNVNPDPTTKLVSNGLYLNIFRELISADVNYFLQNQKSSIAWHERRLSNLTNDKIAVSLNKDLLTALSNIHTTGNKKVNEQAFFEAIRRHLYEGTLDEFDPNYYFYAYNAQLNDKVINYSQTGENLDTINAAFSVFEVNSTNPNYENNNLPLKDSDEYKRTRFLLEDIEASLPILQYEGYTDPLYLNNVGAPVQMIDLTNEDLRIGDGAGYYFSSLTIEGNELPLPNNQSLSDVGHLNPDSKYTTLNILNKAGELRLTASSTLSGHEFDNSYNPSADIGIMYFAIDLKSVGDIANPNSVLNITSATFNLLPEDQAKQHSRNYSFNTVKINIDYRDPLIHYCRDTSTLYLEQDDFDLRAFDVNRSVRSFRIMPRTIPAALILVPGCGSYHNPFNGRSIIKDMDVSFVSRTISLIPSNDSVDNTLSRPYLDQNNIYNELGTPYHGLYEKYKLEDIHGNIFTYNPSSSIFDKCYYYSGTYSRVQPPSSVRGSFPESKLIKVANKLTSLSGVDELTWWDVFRRLRLDEIGGLFYANSPFLTRQLSLGYSNGVPIKHVLSRLDKITTGIPNDSIINDDIVYINPENRTYYEL